MNLSNEIQSAATLWWIPYVNLALAAGFIVLGLKNAYYAYLKRRFLKQPPSNPEFAELLKHIKQPPFELYAVLWLFLGAFMIAVIFI